MFLNILLQAQGGGSMQFVLMMVLMFAVMYFFMIRPQQKKQKEEKNFQTDLKRGDKVVTISGIHGKIVDLTTDSATIETLSGKIKFERNSISKELSVARYPKNQSVIEVEETKS